MREREREREREIDIEGNDDKITLLKKIIFKTFNLHDQQIFCDIPVHLCNSANHSNQVMPRTTRYSIIWKCDNT